VKKPLVFTLCLLGVAVTIFGDLLYVRTRQQAARLQQRLAAVQHQNQQLNDGLHAARTDLAARQTQLIALDTDLGATKTRLTAAEAHNIELTREAVRLRAQITEQALAVTQLNGQIADLSRDLAASRANSASPETIAAYQAAIADLKGKLTVAQASALPPAPASAAPPTAVLTTSHSRTASVVSVGPVSAFVVLDYGSAHGARPDQAMLIRRGTETLADVLISDVRENYSIAQVRPDSLRGALHKGDSAILAH
jgi:hypothetical protein